MSKHSFDFSPSSKPLYPPPYLQCPLPTPSAPSCPTSQVHGSKAVPVLQSGSVPPLPRSLMEPLVETDLSSNLPRDVNWSLSLSLSLSYVSIPILYYNLLFVSFSPFNCGFLFSITYKLLEGRIWIRSISVSPLAPGTVSYSYTERVFDTRLLNGYMNECN